MTEIEQQYKSAQKEIDGQIALWYQKFADNNGITMADAQTYLQGAALKEFKWDVKEYIKYGQENALMGGWTKELENASAKYHITKLEALKIHTQHSLESLCANQLNIVYGTMTQVLETGYYHTAFELQKGFNIGWDIAALNQTTIEHLLSKPWSPDKYNFSEKIWTNKNKLIAEVHKQLSLNIMTGDDPQKAIDAIAKAMKSSKKNVGRLVMTEEAYFSSLSRKECFKDLDVEEYEVVATLDEITSDLCRSLDGKVFPVKDFQAGVTAPPFHPWCRSTTAPKVGDDFGKIGERAARDEETGKTYYIPDDIKYPEWENTFVKGGDKSGFDVLDADGTIQDDRSKSKPPIVNVPAGSNNGNSGNVYKDEKIDFSQLKSVDNSVESGIIKGENEETAGNDVHYIGKIDIEKYKCVTPDIITDEVIITDNQIQHIKERHPNDYERYFGYVKNIIENPDYILEANKPNTAFILKHISDNGKNYQLILRLKTSNDPAEYKNSIITFLKVEEKRYNRYLRTKKILYKSE